ncbi:pre-mRNA-splicing factor cwc22 [Coemansia sp. RSA 2526]|nr:pre-mRNA-splicing factor cwc22 [Coemansia sp. RSA 2526]
MADAASRGDAKEVQQRESWDQLKKRINASGNRANIGNIKDIIVELFGANLVRGRGLLCRLLMRAQSQSTSFTAVYAALVAVINTKLPLIGELMVTRLVLQFCRAFKRDDKGLCISSVMFLAHLSNQRVAHEVLAFQIVSLLLETPTDDSVEVVVAFTREVGAFLGSIVPRVLNYVFDAFRSILHEDRLTHIVITRDLLVMHATLSTEKIMRDLKIDGDLERRYESRLRYDSYKRILCPIKVTKTKISKISKIELAQTLTK